MADIGNGASITFGTSSFTASYISVEPPEFTRESIETSHLGTTSYKTFMADDLVDPGEMTCTIQHDPDEQPPFSGAAETITITYPLPSGMSTAATLAGTGFVTSYKPGSSLENGTLMEAEMTIKFSGTMTFTDSVV